MYSVGIILYILYRLGDGMSSKPVEICVFGTAAFDLLSAYRRNAEKRNRNAVKNAYWNPTKNMVEYIHL